MKLLEYEAKRLLAKSAIAVPQSAIVTNATAHVTIPCVIKSQVPVGGRGKAGGVKVVKTNDDAKKTIASILALPIKGLTPTTLLAEELLSIRSEFYISVVIDRDSSSIEFVANKLGGVEVEDNSTDSFLKVPVNNKTDFDIVGEQLAELYETPGQTFALQELTKKLFDCFVKNDATLLEINPLVLTEQNKLVAGDCKMELDNAAEFRHPDWNFEDTPTTSNFVTLNSHGTVATIANGAGLAMATVDAVADSGLAPANFLDIGGGANEASVLAAFKKINEYENISAIVINIFAGITRCDEVAKAIIAAKSQIRNLPKLYIRLAGTNYHAAEALLLDAKIDLLPTLQKSLEAVKRDVA